MAKEPVFLYLATYATEADAQADYDDLKELHREHTVDMYDVAIVSKDEAGKVHVHRRRRGKVHHTHPIQAQVQEYAVIAELQVRVDEADLPPEFLVEGNGRVDGDRCRADATLGPVEQDDAGGLAASGSGGHGSTRGHGGVGGREPR